MPKPSLESATSSAILLCNRNVHLLQWNDIASRLDQLIIILQNESRQVSAINSFDPRILKNVSSRISAKIRETDENSIIALFQSAAKLAHILFGDITVLTLNLNNNPRRELIFVSNDICAAIPTLLRNLRPISHRIE